MGKTRKNDDFPMVKTFKTAGRLVRYSNLPTVPRAGRGAGGEHSHPADPHIARLARITTCWLRLGDCHPPVAARIGMPHTEYSHGGTSHGRNPLRIPHAVPTCSWQSHTNLLRSQSRCEVCRSLRRRQTAKPKSEPRCRHVCPSSLPAFGESPISIDDR